jgi:hypothetical protein
VAIDDVDGFAPVRACLPRSAGEDEITENRSFA